MILNSTKDIFLNTTNGSISFGSTVKILCIVLARDKVLIGKMMHLLKKFGCEFCSSRLETKFALSHHERFV